MDVKTKTIRQKAEFNATPHEVFEALMDSKKHAQFTGGKATISRKVGGKFSAFDGYAQGVNLEIVAGKKIVQTWRANEEGWPQEHYSKVFFVFKKTAKGTLLEFTHEGVPEAVSQSIAQGWKDYYWSPMKKMLENK